MLNRKDDGLYFRLNPLINPNYTSQYNMQRYNTRSLIKTKKESKKLERSHNSLFRNALYMIFLLPSKKLKISLISIFLGFY